MAEDATVARPVAHPACTACRTLRRRCSRGNPCKTCSQAGTTCLYLKPRRVVRSTTFDQLAERVKHLEGHLLYQSQVLSGSEVYKRDIKFQGLSYKRQKRQELGKRAEGEFEAPCISLPDTESFEKLTEFDDVLSSPLLQRALPVYFDQIHPWIPILHQPTLKQLDSEGKLPEIVAQAILAVTVKFLSVDFEVQKQCYNICKKNVILSSIDRFSTETLQASIILAFDTIGQGKGPRGWSIVSAATRIVDQLGLSREEDDDDTKAGALLNKIGFLSKSKSLIEEEGRRRIFWGVYLLDRFCSFTTGWNTTWSSSIRRRLPVEGEYYNSNCYKYTRYFRLEPGLSQEDSDDKDDDGLGGYAYLIEATELLSKVVTLLLHNRDTFGEDFQLLNSMLVNWKAHLPDKWRTPKISHEGMDENLTLAHVTHNTSIALLHHNIAYPSEEISEYISRELSIQACIRAAMEIKTITSHFLNSVPRIVSPQYCFCVFIAARALLANYIRGSSTDQMSRAFYELVTQLEIMASRWTACSNDKQNLASDLALRLKRANNSHSEIDAHEPIFPDDLDEDEDEDVNNGLDKNQDVFDINFSKTQFSTNDKFSSPEEIYYESAFSLPTMASSGNIAALVPTTAGDDADSSRAPHNDTDFGDDQSLNFVFRWNMT